MVKLGHGFDTALRFQPLEHQSGQIPGEARWGVEHGAVVCCHLVIKHGRTTAAGTAEHVITYNHHHQTAGADILLCTGIDHAELADINRTRQDIGRHVGNQGNIAVLRNPVELQAANGFVGAVMQVGGILAQLPVVLTGNGKIVLFLGAGSDVDVAETTGFINGLS